MHSRGVVHPGRSETTPYLKAVAAVYLILLLAYVYSPGALLLPVGSWRSVTCSISSSPRSPTATTLSARSDAAAWPRYLARDLRHERHVALKVLNPELGIALGSDRFLSEIRLTANLQHPNLLPLFDSGEANGLLFYVMPYVEGESLRARLDRERQLPIDDAVRIAKAVASALDYAHRHGVIHRDLKPENILLHDGEPLVADFGIALAISKAGSVRPTQDGISLGTPAYMSPEQTAGDRVIDGRADIYSLGAVTYEMLAGEPPHAASTVQATIAKLMTEEPRPLTGLRCSVPPHVDAAVRRGGVRRRDHPRMGVTVEGGCGRGVPLA